MAAGPTDGLPRVTGDVARLTGDLDRHGYCLAEGLLTGQQVDGVRAILTDLEATSNGSLPGQDNTGDAQDWPQRGGDQWQLLMAGEDGLDHLVLHPTALAFAGHLLGAQFHLSGFSAHTVHPGNQVMDLHTDQWWLPQPVMPGEVAVKAGDIGRDHQPYGAPTPATWPINPPVVINVMWAVTDFTAACGSTRLVPGSHLSGLHPDPAATYDTVDAEVPAGGAVIWDARTWHASGRNDSNAARIGITATYCAPQFRQLQNFTCGLTPEAQAGLSDELRELLGFKLWSSYGATDDFEAAFARPGYERAKS